VASTAGEFSPAAARVHIASPAYSNSRFRI
jgi:hypothetical protein